MTDRLSVSWINTKVPEHWSTTEWANHPSSWPYLETSSLPSTYCILLISNVLLRSLKRKIIILKNKYLLCKVNFSIRLQISWCTYMQFRGFIFIAILKIFSNSMNSYNQYCTSSSGEYTRQDNIIPDWSHLVLEKWVWQSFVSEHTRTCSNFCFLESFFVES